MKLGKRILMLALAGTLALLPALSACNKGGDTGDNGENNGEQNQPENPDTPENPDNPNVPDDEKDKEPSNEPATYTIELGKDMTLALGGDYAASTLAPVVTRNDEPVDAPAVTYSVADNNVASVADDGVVTAVAKGETTVTASFSANDTVISDTIAIRVLETTTKENVNSFSAEYVNLFGRTYISSKKLMLNNVCTGIEVSFTGTSLSLTLGRIRTDYKIRTYLDGETAGTVQIIQENLKDPKILLYEGLDSGVHTVRILKASAPSAVSTGGYIEIAELDTDGDFCIPAAKPDFKMEIIGDSITQGVGSAGSAVQAAETVENSDATITYACLTAQALGADFSIMALEGQCVKDSTTCGYEFYTQKFPGGSDFDNSTFVPDVVVLGFGENDVWHATSAQFPYTLEQFRIDYADMIRLVRSIHPDAVIFCAYGMMPASAKTEAKTAIQGAIADTGFENVYEIRLTSNEAGANSHPNAKAHKENAEKLTKFIKEKLGL